MVLIRSPLLFITHQSLIQCYWAWSVYIYAMSLYNVQSVGHSGRVYNVISSDCLVKYSLKMPDVTLCHWKGRLPLFKLWSVSVSVWCIHSALNTHLSVKYEVARDIKTYHFYITQCDFMYTREKGNTLKNTVFMTIDIFLHTPSP